LHAAEGTHIHRVDKHLGAETPPGSDVADGGAFIGPRLMRPGQSEDFDCQQTDFAKLPGVHVELRTLGGTKREYVRGDGTVLAARRTEWRRNPLYPNPRVTVNRSVFEERLLGKRRNNHMRSPREVVDLATGKRLFRIDGLNFKGSASAVIHFSESRSYTFPVEGIEQPYKRVSKPETRLGYPVMSAMDDKGHVALRFAEPRPLEAGKIVISPDQPITSDLLVMMATASPFLAFFFMGPGD
jgi:hypothetical protein